MTGNFNFENVSYFEEAAVSATITADSASDFFRVYGIFYKEDAEVGDLAANLQGQKYSIHHLDKFKPAIEKDARLISVMKPFLENPPSFCFPIAAEPGNFYSLTIEPDQEHRTAIYMWRPGTRIEFSCGSHTGVAVGVKSAYGLFQRPYVNLKKTRKLEDVAVNMANGGVMIVHAGLAVQVQSGSAIGFGCERQRSDRPAPASD